MELPWFHDLDDAALDAALRSLEGGDGDARASVAVHDAPPFAWLTHKMDTDVTVSVNPQAPLQVQLRFASGESDSASSHGSEKAVPVVAETRGSRKRQEMQRLRDEVEALQSTLSELNDVHQETMKQEHSDQWMTKVVDSAWESMASRQRSQLRRAQAENRKLRRAVEEHDRMVDHLQQLIQSHEARLRAGRLCGMDPSRLINSQGLSDEDNAMLESLAEVLKPMHLRTDVMLSDPRLTKLSAHFHNINVERGPDSLAIQRIDSRTVPFDFQKTSDAVWRNLLDRITSQRRFKVEEMPDETLRARFISYMRVAGFDGYATCYMALKRIVEPNRVVMLRSAVFVYMEDDMVDSPAISVLQEDSPIDEDIKRLVLHGSPVRHFLWATVSRPSHAQLQGVADPSSLTQIQTCSISLPNVVGHSEAEVQASSKFYTEISRQMYLQSQEEVDNLLLGIVPTGHSKNHITFAVAASCRTEPIEET